MDGDPSRGVTFLRGEVEPSMHCIAAKHIRLKIMFAV